MRCLLTEMYEKQYELDMEIAENHHISYDETKKQRVLALLVELGEFANATRCFKFWSFKPSESKERVLDEYADGLHFLLSIGLACDYKVNSIDMDEDVEGDLVDAILKCYEAVSYFGAHRNLVSYVNMFEAYLKILSKIGYTWSDAYDAYFAKLAENHHRQETNY